MRISQVSTLLQHCLVIVFFELHEGITYKPWSSLYLFILALISIINDVRVNSVSVHSTLLTVRELINSSILYQSVVLLICTRTIKIQVRRN